MLPKGYEERIGKRKSIYLRASTAGAVLLLLAGCTSAKKGHGSVATHDFPADTPPVSTSAAPATPAENPIEKAIATYGQNLNEQQIARVAMNTCVAWKNQSGGLTVTYNPGVAQVKQSATQYGEVLVWGNRVVSQGYPKPSLIVSDGPGIFHDGTQVTDEIQSETIKVFFDKPNDPDIDDRVSTRHVTSSLTLGATSATGFYHDAQTGMPVIRSELVQGSLDLGTVIPICYQLKN